MNKKIIFQILGLLFTLWGCAVAINEPHDEDLVTKFELDNAQLEKFKSGKIQPPPVEDGDEVENGPIADKTETKAPELQKKEKHTPVVSKEKSTTKTASSSAVNATAVESHVLKNLPEDYPPQFAEYDQKFEKMWKLFKPHVVPGEELVINIKYLGLNAGIATIRTFDLTTVANKKAWHFKARLKSAEYYKYIYQLDDSIESYVSQESFLPLKYQLLQRESAQEIDDLQLFDDEKLKTFFWYRRMKRGVLTRQEQSNYVPKYIQDSFSALFFARGLPLEKNVVYEYPVVTRAKIWIIKLEVIDTEVVEFKNEKIMAYKIKAETRFPGVLKKRGDIMFWISADARRMFLQFNAKVKIGSISGELVEYKNPSENNLKH